MKKHKRFLSLLIAVCLLLSVVELPEGGHAEAASDKKITLKEGKSVALKLKKPKRKIRRVTWNSKNRGIASVSKKGRVKAKSAGNTKITAKITLRNGKKYTSVYRICVRKKKTMFSPKAMASTKKPIATGKPAATSTKKPIATGEPTATSKPRIKAVDIAQGGLIGWKPFQAEKVTYKSMYCNPDLENQFVTSRTELMTLMKKLRAGNLTTDMELFLEELDAYDQEYFQKHVLCLVNVQLTCGYRPSITQLYQKGNGGVLPDIVVQYDQINEIGEGQAAPDVMINHLYRLEIAKTALNGTDMPSVTAAPPAEVKPTADPTVTPQPSPQVEIRTASTAQREVADWKYVETELVSCTKLMSNPCVKNQLITSYDELTALNEDLKGHPFSSNDQIISELKKYDEAYFQNHVLGLLAVQLDIRYSPSVRQIYCGDGGGVYPDIMMQYAEEKAYEDDLILPCVMVNYLYRIEIAKSKLLPDSAKAK